MERYKSNEKIKNKNSTFSVLKNFFKTSKATESRLFEVCDRMKELKNQENGEQSPEYKELSLEADKLDKKMETIDKAKAEIKKLFLKIGAIVLAVGITISGAIAGIAHGIQSSREDKVMEALSKQDYSLVEMFEQSPDKLTEFAKSPKEVTQLALDTLKQNLANHYGVSKDGFEILYKTEIPDNEFSDTKRIYEINYGDENVCSHITRTGSDGDKKIDKATMPEELRKAIDSIVAAQENPEDIGKAYNALYKANSDKTLKEIETSLPEYLPPAEKDIER